MVNNHSFGAFCLKVALLLMILFEVDRLVGATFVKMKDMGLANNPENMWLKTAYAVEKVDADVVIIGSSKASHHYVSQILEESLGLTTYNCGQDGCFFLYQNCIVNMILDRYNPKIILWDVYLGSFVSKEPTSEYQNIRYLSPYYNDNDWARNYINSESSLMNIKMRSRMFAYNSKLLYYAFPLLSKESSILKGYLPLPMEGYSFPTMAEVKNEDNENNTINYKYLGMLNQTIERCKSNGVTLNLCISPEFRIKTAIEYHVVKDIENIASSSGIMFHDAYSDSIFMQDSTLFKDAGHLNHNGAVLFTEQLIGEVQSISH